MCKSYMIIRAMNEIIENLFTLRRTIRRPSPSSGGGSHVSVNGEIF